DSISKILKKLPYKYNIDNLSRKYDDFIPNNEKDKQNIEKFKSEKKEIMKLYKKLPDFNTKKYSIYISDNLPWYGSLCLKETEEKVNKLKNDIKEILIDNKIQEQFITGKWDLDYKNTKDCSGNIMTENENKKNTIEFFENSKYKRFIWGFESGGSYQINKNELWLDEKYKIGDKEGSGRGKYLLNLEKIEKNKLIISFTECDMKVYQVYKKIEKSKSFIKTGTEFEKADDLLIKYSAERNVFSRKFTKPSMSYLLPDNVGIIILYDKQKGKNIIVELLQCNNPKAAKDIRVWENIKQIELTEKNYFR
ncbi:MAG: hypothetical protein K8R68_02095, partial [Bacteroidales bacterium]|nr:hypothetical protein [Bacteroidales bacterium]